MNLPLLSFIKWLLIPRALYCPKATNPQTEMGYLATGFYPYKCRWCDREGMCKPVRDICWRFNCYLKEKDFAKG